MIGPTIASLSEPLALKLASKLEKKGVTRPLLNLLLIAAGIATIILFGLQYFWCGLAAYLFHRLLCQTASPEQITARSYLFRDYFFLSGAMIAMLWTGADFGIPVAFLFWGMLLNTLSIISFNPKIKILGLFELSLIMLAMAAAPDYIPAIAILGGVACLISTTASFFFRDND
ncbi:MAG: hypothetical protein RBR86_07205 [Pseudobdellovibrionaceae bacterium]|jgi:hypothetical protein|nr:hypothetical protein [Pseudobdellovibrionaceae bacterium]